MGKWKKLGLLFKVDNLHPILKTHASNPVASHLSGNSYRIFFCSRDASNKSSVTFIDIDIERLEIENIHGCPIFSPGNHPSFYSHGISLGGTYTTVDGKEYLLFMGWLLTDKQHWTGRIGRLEIVNKENLVLCPNNVFLGLDNEDPISLSYPCVIYHNSMYKMWYGSTIDWDVGNGEMLHVLKYATSNDGEEWKKHGLSIPYKIGETQAFSRPSAIGNEEGIHLWFSYRGNNSSYKIGYTHSKDGAEWDKLSACEGLSISPDQWDSEMLCYPFVFEHKHQRYMLYNGNDYGKSGFGIAIFEK